MSNTIIQIKRSTSSSVPPDGSLVAGELAHSYTSNVLFVGSSDGSTVLPVGGKFYIDRANATLNIAIAAYATANGAVLGLDAAIIAYNQANTAYGQANVAYGQANTSYNQANAAYGRANTVGGAAFDQANAAYGRANTVGGAAFDQSNTATTIGSAAYGQANTATTIGSAAFGQANAVGGAVTTANNTAIAAFAKANAALPLTGGTLTGTLRTEGMIDIQERYSAVVTETPNTINCMIGNYFTRNITNNQTITFINPPASGNAYAMILRLANAGSFTITWANTPKWPSGTAPTLTGVYGNTDVLIFVTENAGGIWRGSLVQKDSR